MIAFYQALGIIGYVTLIAAFFSNTQNWFGQMPEKFFAPLLMLTLLSTSALICGLIVFAYPIKLFLQTKKFAPAFKIVLKTAAWLAGFSLLIMLGIVVLK